MGFMDDVKLRDQRKPGHCWQDNELYDAFGPVIGPNAILVYVQMTRNCYGAESIRLSSRDLARDSGLSKDTVWRAMRAMERVGMLRAVSGGKGKLAEYHLTDLKELAARHGGTYVWHRQSYVFSPQQAVALKAIAAGAVGDVEPASTVSVGDSFPASTVSVRDSLPAPTVSVRDSAATELSHQKDRTVSPEGHPYTKQQNLIQNTPLPPKGGSSVPDDEAEVLEDIRVMRLACDRRPTAEKRAELLRLQAKLLGLRRVRGTLLPPAQAVHDPPHAVRMRRRRGPSDGCSAMGAMG
jgi:hypothetical protein